jgi:hypothetical protein
MVSKTLLKPFSNGRVIGLSPANEKSDIIAKEGDSVLLMQKLVEM